MTHVKCPICKKEYPMSELRPDKSGNFIVCKECYNNMQENIVNPVMNHKKKTKSGFFNKIKSFFISKEQDNEPEFKVTSDMEGYLMDENRTSKRPIIVRDEPIKRKKSKTEKKISFHCNNCQHRFQRRENTRIHLCPNCGSTNIEIYKELDANSILNSV